MTTPFSFPTRTVGDVLRHMNPPKPKKLWMGSPPVKCDLCQKAITKTFVDGATQYGPWANMCPSCHKARGRGLGIGKGQKYKLEGTDWVKAS
jgi:hypothetical protein